MKITHMLREPDSLEARQAEAQRSIILGLRVI
jgi:hypothetical protein